jgi:hypothetical protein
VAAAIGVALLYAWRWATVREAALERRERSRLFWITREWHQGDL